MYWRVIQLRGYVWILKRKKCALIELHYKLINSKRETEEQITERCKNNKVVGVVCDFNFPNIDWDLLTAGVSVKVRCDYQWLNLKLKKNIFESR